VNACGGFKVNIYLRFIGLGLYNDGSNSILKAVTLWQARQLVNRERPAAHTGHYEYTFFFKTKIVPDKQK
jgi:hypothetical protein